MKKKEEKKAKEKLTKNWKTISSCDKNWYYGCEECDAMYEEIRERCRTIDRREVN